MLVRVLNAFLDTILPRKGRAMRLDQMELERVPLSPQVHDLLGVKITTLMDYRESSAQDLIQSLKYDGAGKAARLLAEIVADYLTEEIAADSTFSTKKIVLVPIPLHGARERERGFNQIESVLRCLPKDFQDGSRARIASHILVRSRATKPQTRLARSERLSNVAGAFALSKNADLSKMHIYVFDDVTTTGATLANAATPLRRAGAVVSLIALARA